MMQIIDSMLISIYLNIPLITRAENHFHYIILYHYTIILLCTNMLVNMILDIMPMMSMKSARIGPEEERLDRHYWSLCVAGGRDKKTAATKGTGQDQRVRAGFNIMRWEMGRVVSHSNSLLLPGSLHDVLTIICDFVPREMTGLALSLYISLE